MAGPGRGIWWRLAWGNLWRNRRRTVITASALSFGFVAAVVMVGLFDGMIEEMLENGTELITGQVQIHSDDFRPERSVHSTLGGREGVDVDALTAAVADVSSVDGTAARVFGGGLVSSGEETVGALLLGVQPERELGVSRLMSSFVEGGAPGTREIAIGHEMAEKIEVGVGDEVVLVAPAADGSMGNDLFIVSGIFRIGSGGLDSNYGLVRITDLQELMVLSPGRIHEIAISVERTGDADEVADRIREVVSPMASGLEVEPWSEFLVQLYFFTTVASLVNSVIAFIIFGMAIFGVANTMLLATYERRREFAVVRALGTSPGAVAQTVLFEGILLGAVALVAGAVIAVPVMMWLHNFPIDLSRFAGSYSLFGSTIRPYLRVEYSWDGPLVSALALGFTGVVAALWPAWRAVRIPPADALADR